MGRSRRILIIANVRSPLDRERGLVGFKGGHQIYWYSFPKAYLADMNGTAKSPKDPMGWLSFLFSPFFLRRAIHEIQPDLIHVFYAYHQLNNLILHRFKPLVVTVMGGDILSDQSFQGKKKQLTKKMLEGATIITSKSIFLDSALNQIGNYAHKIRRVTWGVDTKKFHPCIDVNPLRQHWGIHTDDIVFFSPRICHPLYNQHIILQAFSNNIQRRTPRVKAKLLISELLAEASYVKRLRRMINDLELREDVRFVGAIPHQEMPAYLNLADIMVAIPRSDGMPQSLYEAMACGTYPILGNLESYRELIQDSANGRLVEMSDVEALGEAMHWVATHPEHRKTAAVINRQQVIEIADKDTQVQLVNSIYDELLQKYTK